jgi:uncharacterized protein
MRLLMLLAVLLLGIWLWRSNRESGVKAKGRDTGDKTAPMEMVGCSLCAVHVLTRDAVQGKKGFYCCQEHRQRAEP